MRLLGFVVASTVAVSYGTVTSFEVNDPGLAPCSGLPRGVPPATTTTIAYPPSFNEVNWRNVGPVTQLQSSQSQQTGPVVVCQDRARLQTPAFVPPASVSASVAPSASLAQLSSGSFQSERRFTYSKECLTYNHKGELIDKRVEVKDNLTEKELQAVFSAVGSAKTDSKPNETEASARVRGPAYAPACDSSTPRMATTVQIDETRNTSKQIPLRGSRPVVARRSKFSGWKSDSSLSYSSDSSSSSEDESLPPAGFVLPSKLGKLTQTAEWKISSNSGLNDAVSSSVTLKAAEMRAAVDDLLAQTAPLTARSLSEVRDGVFLDSQLALWRMNEWTRRFGNVLRAMKASNLALKVIDLDDFQTLEYTAIARDFNEATGRGTLADNSSLDVNDFLDEPLLAFSTAERSIGAWNRLRDTLLTRAREDADAGENYAELLAVCNHMVSEFHSLLKSLTILMRNHFRNFRSTPR
ncbi:MAG: hypothetical protein MHM6MM_006762 [Cercozoa sp. M6MM]